MLRVGEQGGLCVSREPGHAWAGSRRKEREEGEEGRKEKKKKKRGASEIRGDGREPIVASTQIDVHEKRGVQEKD